MQIEDYVKQKKIKIMSKKIKNDNQKVDQILAKKRISIMSINLFLLNKFLFLKLKKEILLLAFNTMEF